MLIFLTLRSFIVSTALIFYDILMHYQNLSLSFRDALRVDILCWARR